MVQLQAFRGIDPSVSRVRLASDSATDNASERVVGQGRGLGGRIARWFGEVFTDGKAQNKAAGLALVKAVEQDVGSQAADVVRQHLTTRLESGKPLSARRVNMCLDLAAKFNAPQNLAQKLEGIDARVIQVLQDPKSAPAKGMQKEQLALYRHMKPAKNDQQMLATLESSAQLAASNVATELNKRLHETEFQNHPDWADFVLKAPWDKPVEQVKKDFQTIRNGQTERTNLALAKAVSPGGQEFEAILQEAKDIVFDGGDAPVPLAGLQEKIVAKVKNAQRQADGSLRQLSQDNVTSISLDVLIKRCENMKAVIEHISTLDLNEKTMAFAMDVFEANPDLSPPALVEQAKYARDMDESIVAFANGDEPQALMAFASTYKANFDDMANSLFPVLLKKLSPEQIAHAYRAIESSAVVRNIASFEHAGMHVLPEYDYQDDQGVRSPELRSLMFLSAMHSKFLMLKNELASGMGVDPNMENSSELAPPAPKSYLLSNEAYAFAKEAKQALADRSPNQPTFELPQDLTYAREP